MTGDPVARIDMQLDIEREAWVRGFTARDELGFRPSTEELGRLTEQFVDNRYDQLSASALDWRGGDC